MKIRKNLLKNSHNVNGNKKFTEWFLMNIFYLLIVHTIQGLRLTEWSCCINVIGVGKRVDYEDM